MSDANNGIDDYRSKNQMNGTSGNDTSSSGASAGNQYGMNQSSQQQFSGQQYPYGQPVQQQMRQSYGRHAQPQMSQPQMSQPQFGQPRMNQPQFGRQSFGQPVHQQFAQPPIGRTYGRPPYGGAPFATRAGYEDYMLDPSDIETERRKLCIKWNNKEILSAIIAVVISSIFAFVITSFIIRYGFHFSFNISRMIKSVFKYDDQYNTFPATIIKAGYIFPFAIILSFAQVLRKKFFTAVSGIFVLSIMIIALICYCLDYYVKNRGMEYYFVIELLMYYFCILIFLVFVEILQWAITKYKPENDLKYMLVNFLSVIIFYIADGICCYINGFYYYDSSLTSRLLSHSLSFFIAAISMLVILPYLVALLLKSVKFTKFLNPEREMMHL